MPNVISESICFTVEEQKNLMRHQTSGTMTDLKMLTFFVASKISHFLFSFPDVHEICRCLLELQQHVFLLYYQYIS